jgi:hypothetical protein
MRRILIALSAIAGIVGSIAPASGQYYRPGYNDYPPPYHGDPYERRYRQRAIQCPQGLVPVPDRYGRMVCAPWRPTRGSECPPGYTLQGGQCKPYRGP